MAFHNQLPEYANVIESDTLIGGYALLPSRTNIHPIIVEANQLQKISFMPNNNTEQLIIRISFSTVPLEYPINGFAKCISPNGMTVYLYDVNGTYPPVPEVPILSRFAGQLSILRPTEIAVNPGTYYLNVANLSNISTTYLINVAA